MNALLKALLISFAFLITSQAYGQVLPIRFSSGIVHSDVRFVNSFSFHEENYNTPKIGFYASIGSGYKFKNWFQLRSNFNYQERLPLETFYFPQQPNRVTIALIGIPTSPQSKRWDSNLFKRQLNFEYLYWDISPTFTFSKKRITISGGAGLYAGYLMNRGQLVMSIDDFPLYSSAFTGETGYITYSKFDLGWTPSFEILFTLNSRTKIGLSLQAYLSHTRLINDYDSIFFNTPYFDFNRDSNITWQAYNMGLTLTHQFKY